jgi:hypothetical protein
MVRCRFNALISCQVLPNADHTEMTATIGTDTFILCAAALLNYETVAYFCNQDLERTNYATAIADYQVHICSWVVHKAGLVNHVQVPVCHARLGMLPNYLFYNHICETSGSTADHRV